MRRSRRTRKTKRIAACSTDEDEPLKKKASPQKKANSSDEEEALQKKASPPKKASSNDEDEPLKKKASPPKKASSSDEDEPLKKKASPPRKENANKIKLLDGSSSESDLENYLKPADQIDLNSSFFDVSPTKLAANDNEPTFDEIEKNILEPSNNLSSESDTDEAKFNSIVSKPKIVVDDSEPSTSYNFQEIKSYNKKMEEAMKFVEQYKAKKAAEDVKVADLLAIGESMTKTSPDCLSEEMVTDSENDDWEEVNTIQHEIKDTPKKSIEIVVSMSAGKQKKKVDLMMMLRRKMNRVKKENQVYIHKVSLLCWIAHGNYVNNVLNEENLLGLSLSLLPSQKSYPSDRVNLKYIEQISNWYKNFMKIKSNHKIPDLPLEKLLQLQISKKEVYSYKFLVYIFVCIMRSLGISCRLVISLQPEPLRPPAEELFSEATTSKKSQVKIKQTVNKSASKSNMTKTSGEKKTDKTSTKVKQTDQLKKSEESTKNVAMEETKPSTSKDKRETMPNKVSKKGEPDKSQKSKKNKVTANESSTSTPNGKPNLSRLSYSVKKPAVVIRRSTRKMASKKSKENATETIPQLDGPADSDSDISTTKKKPNLKKLQAARSPIKTRTKSSQRYTEMDSDDDFEITSPTKRSPLIKGLDVRNDVMDLVKKSIVDDNYKMGSKLMKGKRKSPNTVDNDYIPLKTRKRTKSENEFQDKVKVKQRIPPKSELLKLEAENKEQKAKRIGIDYWVEVFVEDEEKWISVDVVHGQIHCIKEIHNRASQPVSYVLGWDNEGHIKDITKRYSPAWNTITRKLRVQSIWWNVTLKSFLGPTSSRDKDEDEDLERQQLDQPLPKTITEYKDHPLYVLPRHLLKFQAIYPPDAAALGFIRKEPVYPRDCVYTLHSRDIWLKQAKVVKVGEKPYKIVKARPKYDKLSNKMITDQLLEIFGIWQVQDYEPPQAENGVVPRNAYGNVDLFKTCMLPKGTAHIRLPGLNKVAYKMNIDCAPAVIGFDFHGGWSHPTFDGFVVCKEHEDAVIAAWYIEQEEIEKREQEKINKRVYGNWRRLIKGVLITQRLKIKYNVTDTNKVNDKGKTKKGKH